MKIRAFAVGSLLVCLLVVGARAGAVRANGVPQLVKLTYLAGVSNWGPTDGEGVLEFSFAEAYARVDVKNLKPADGFSYEGWLVAPDGSSFRVGDIGVNASGVGKLEAKLAGLKRLDYNLFVVAGRPTATTPGQLPTQKSIAGRFTVISDNPAIRPGESRPLALPDTGEAAGTTTAEKLGRTLAVMAVASGVAIVGLRLTRRRTAHD